MQLTKATTRKVYTLEALPLARLMSQGIKLSEEVVSRMGIDVSNDDRGINYAVDTDVNSATYNTIFLYKDGEGRKVGENNCFVNSGLKAEMLIRANAADLEVKGGNQVHFVVGTAVEVEGVKFFPLTFKSIVLASEDEDAPVAKSTPNAAPVAQEVVLQEEEEDDDDF